MLSHLFKAYPYFEELEFQNCSIDDKILQELAKGMNDKQSIFHINLRQNLFGHKGFEAFINASMKTMALTNLELEDFDLVD